MTNQNECGVCRFASFAKGADGKITFTHRVCKRFPPRPLTLPSATGIQVQALWPIVAANEWCGEFQARGETMPLPGSLKPADEEAERPQ